MKYVHYLVIAVDTTPLAKSYVTESVKIIK